MNRSKWERRIQRAEELASAHPFAAEVLQFYKHIAGFQQALYSHIETSYIEAANDNASNKKASGLLPAGLLPEDLDLPLLLPKFSEFLSAVEKVAPQPIAQSAADLNAQGDGRWQDLLTSYWRTAPDFQPTPEHTETLLAWIFLQPYAEYLADHSKPVPHNERTAVCPFCSGRPLVGVLRPEGDGAKRSLICSLCSTEWTYGRIVCPACGEETVEKLAIYTASQFHQVRVEACDTCHYYIKTVDLTKNGHAVPVVDELATIPLNLWAQEHQYIKLQPNLLGI
ncbi:MAG TPA: formate dehydrogenase accessory protein FdhE [Terriglobales bacterium]|jgi:FdhE protein|nr:formate dehydrogenase accessory protein FdhE [Terriglobales bacterium]